MNRSPSPRPGRHAPAGTAALMGLALGLAGCSATARIIGQAPADLPLPPGMEVAFNHRSDHHYHSPINGRRRSGDDLEALVLGTIQRAETDIQMAVQELSLPRVAEALVAKHRAGIKVRVVLENTYSTPWSLQHQSELNPHKRLRHTQLSALADRNHDGLLSSDERRAGDAVAILERGGVPLIDDTADGSAGSGLMHHKFLVVDGRWLVTGSANFTPSCIHGDAGDSRTLGNVNHLLRIESPALSALFDAEFERMWGDGPGGSPDSRFGIGKEAGPVQAVMVGPTRVEVLFAPQRRRDPANGLSLLAERMSQAQTSLDMGLFVFSAQILADRLAELQQRGVRIRLLADPGFASRSFSEVLDLLGVALPDRFCKLEAGNTPWQQPIEGVGTPQLARGDKMHHKIAVIDAHQVITGSFNWSPAAAHANDETLLILHSPALAAHFSREMDRMWQGAELGITARMQRKLDKMRRACGSGSQRPLAAQRS
ncbi:MULTISPECIES: phosphatidylserine/phosphatidylglycerophosphate/cardiolipin synthase family protein [Synechococcales]|uniref:phosphatidylserine/phosphatidylglycerophosphate/ cardiolipin synthase family protein n=1 Tax=Synechococcus sp. CS-1324 TaxID=2847980 RepID=UPI0037DA4ABA